MAVKLSNTGLGQLAVSCACQIGTPNEVGESLVAGAFYEAADLFLRVANVTRFRDLSLPKTSSAGVAAVPESEHDPL